MLPDEKKLVDQAREGDRAAFEQLYKINREKIFRLAYGFVKNSADAEDLLQDIFTRAFLAIKRFKPEQGLFFSTWLYRIGINHSISFLRKFKRQHMEKGHQIPLQKNTAHDEAENGNPERLVEIEEMQNIFKSGLDTLSPRQRTIVVLRYYSGFKIKDIAKKMNCSEGSIKKQLSRGFCKLKKQLNVYLKGEE